MIAILLAACTSLLPSAPSEHEDEAHHVEEGHVEVAGHVDVVTLSEAALANARIVVEAVQLSSLAGSGVAPARIALDPRREAHVSAVMAGQLERILVRPGDHVSDGQALATVLSPDLGEAVGAHLAASARLEAAMAKRDRIAQLLAEGVSSKSQLADAEAEFTVAAAEAEAAEERLRVFGVEPSIVVPAKGQHFSSRFSIRSPVEGDVLTVDATLGKSVEPGDGLFRVGNLDVVWLLADVYERDIAAVKAGSTVSFTVAAYGDERFDGTVDQVGDWLDPDSRTAEVRVIVANADHRLKPNMFAQARLTLADSAVAEGLALPADAIQQVEGASSVFIEVKQGTYAVRAVRAETLADGRQQILMGLSVGDRVVIDGAFTLKHELEKSELGEGHAH